MEIMSCDKTDCCNSDCLKEIYQVAEIVRNYMVKHYGTGYDLSGYCIEASELIVKILHLIGYDNAKTVDGYVRYDDPLDKEEEITPHVWVEVPCEDSFLYIDVTADQFNYGMDAEHEYAPIILCENYPYGVIRKKPDDV